MKLTKEYIQSLVAQYIIDKHKAKKWTARKDWVQYSGPYFDSAEYVNAVGTLLDEWLVLGNDAIEFEKRFPALLGKKYGIVVNSGSSANLLMMAAMMSRRINISKHKLRVIVPVAGFPTTLNPILQLGAVPYFVDIELDTLNIDLEKAEDRMKEHVDLITFAHVLGNPPNMDRVMELCKKYNVTLLEDCCDALGSTYDDKPLGSFGRFSTCSFYPAHHITSLPYNEPILLQSPDGKILSQEIGVFVENTNYVGWKCPSFDKNGDIKWRNITGVVSHPFTDKHVYKIITQTGRTSTITGNHSLFRLNNEGDVVTVHADKLKEGDFIVVPNKLPNIETKTTIEYINYAKGSWKKYISNIELSEDIANLMGWFVAEGSLFKSNRGNYNITFTLNKNELSIATELSRVIKEKFHIHSRIYKKGKNAISLQFSNKAIYEFLEKHCGNGAHNKHIPEFIFSSKSAIKWKFIHAYYNGDGHHHIIKKSLSDSFDCKTVSQTLAMELHHLLLMLGVSSRVSVIPPMTKVIHNNRKETITSTTYSVCYNNSLRSIVNSKSFRTSSHVTFPRVKNDLTMLKITKIEKIAYNRPNVYDISINGYENFVSGIGFIVHNTGEGGFVACNNEEDEKIIRSLREWGRGCYCVGKKANLSTKGTCGCRFKNWLPSLPSEVFDHKYVYEEVGYNLKPIEMQCSIGLAQLDKLPEIHAKRRANHACLTQIFAPYEEFFHFHKATMKANPSWFSFPISVRDGAPFKRSEFTRYMEENKIQTRNYFGGNLLLQPSYTQYKDMQSWTDQDVKTHFPVATKVTTDTLFLGTSPVITTEQLDYVKEIVNNFFKKL